MKPRTWTFGVQNAGSQESRRREHERLGIAITESEWRMSDIRDERIANDTYPINSHGDDIPTIIVEALQHLTGSMHISTHVFMKGSFPKTSKPSASRTLAPYF